MPTEKKHLKNPLYFIAAVYLLTVLLFLLFRYVFLQIFTEPNSPPDSSMVINSFLIGKDFDMMVAGYLILLPGLLLCINFLLNKPIKLLTSLAIGLIDFLLVITVLICCTDIPYYKFFHSRITTSVLLWMADFWQSIKFVFAESKFYPFIVLLIVVIFLLKKTVSFFKKKLLYMNPGENYPAPLRMLLVVFTMVIIGGSLLSFNHRRPPGIREGFFTNNAFINQLTLNPVLTFFESFSVFRIDYLEDSVAIQNAQRSLEITAPASTSPVLRVVKNDSLPLKKNVVLVLMESMSAHRMNYFGEKKNLTPFLDSLAKAALFFPQFYSCGIHTCNGVYGTLFGMPSLMAKHPMSNVQSAGLIFSGIPQTLKENGYSNLFFCTHGSEFDNMGYFLPRNGIDKIWGAKDYPASKIENVWGVSDEFLFDFALDKTDSVAKIKKPFFSTILTISTHPPQQMPTQTVFKAKSTEVFDQVFEYADWAIAQFIQKCKSKEWYSNTIFIFLADHGINLPSQLEAPLSLNHIPLIIFSPDTSFKKEIISSPGIQCDVYPTLMHLLGMSYENNTMGIDLLSQKRPYAYFSQDNRLCVINDEYYFVADKYGSEYLYKYNSGSNENYNAAYPSLTDSMKNYAYSFLQTTQWMIENKKTSVVK